MTGQGPSTDAGPRFGELALRVLSALILVPLAIGAAYVGGWLFALFWAIAAVGVLWEWMSLVAGAERVSVLTIAGVAIVLATALMGVGHLTAALIVLLLTMLAAAALARAERRTWVALGTLYSGLLSAMPTLLRNDEQQGFVAILLVFAVVWTTDIVAYFVGRAVGGPKLMPKVSPKKTWSGALGGAAGAVLAAIAVARLAGLPSVLAVALLALVLSVIAQAGDLFESFLKRRFGAKDSGHLIPGHGGLMDRLDGFVTAVTAAALIGLMRGGVETPARALLTW
ncbi:MAG: phosphatidate cytidylyltransferase [Hyphomicrobiales bacterium]|nr:phosphatidate cytidylyltransferase [Hyphomicrobiales bacterium]